MTDKERQDYVYGKFLECIKPITNVRNGSGCQVGESYWFEYVHDTNDGENPDADAFYRKLSDNDHNDEVYITDEELIVNFRVWKDYKDDYEHGYERLCEDVDKIDHLEDLIELIGEFIDDDHKDAARPIIYRAYFIGLETGVESVSELTKQ